MKLFIFLMCCFTFSLSANSFAQQEKVNLDLQGVSIKTLFSEIQRQTNLHFIFNTEQTEQLNKLTVKAKEESVKSVLDRVFEGTGFTYTFRDNIIMVRFEGKNSVQQANKEMEIRGVVKDKSGEPLPGVTVLIVGTQLGTATGMDGDFLLRVPEQDSVRLRFSFVGMKTKDVPYKKNQPALVVVLEEEAESIGEIVVTGYQQIEKRNLTSSVVTVKTSELKTIGASSIEQMLQGVVPGLSVVNTSAAPGAAPKIRIRGTATISGNADPLWVLDGVILENSVPVTAADLNSPDVMNMFNSVIGGINPNDIESITVLKDASATAMYGARGANGVILVSTKKGVEGSVYTAFRYEAIASMPTRKIDVVDPITYMKAYNEALQTRDPLAQPKYTADRIANTGSDRFPEWLYPANDWYDLLFKNVAINHHLGLSVRGGTKIMQYYASIGHNYDEGMLKTDRLNQFNVNIRNNTTSLRINMNIDMTPTAKLVINSNSTYDSYHGPLADVTAAYGLAFNANPVDYAAVYPADDTYVFPHIRYGYETINSKNPYASIQSGYVERSRFATTNRVEYIQNLSALLKGLEIRANVSLYKESYDSTPFQTVPYQYRLLDYNHQTGKHTLEQLLEGDKNLKVDPNNKVTIDETQLAGEFRLYYNGNWGNHSVSYTGLFNLSQFASSQGRSLFDAIKHRNMGLSMRLSYGFKERYYLEGSFGYNGSERFAKNNRFGFFPSVGISYVISKEPFMSGTSHWLSFLKLRGSYGKVGNDGIGTGSGIGENGRYVYLPNIGKDSQDHYIIKVSSINSIYPLVSDSRTL